MTEINTQLYLNSAIINGKNAYHPVTLEAQIIRSDYGENPYSRNVRENLGAFAKKWDTLLMRLRKYKNQRTSIQN